MMTDRMTPLHHPHLSTSVVGVVLRQGGTARIPHQHSSTTVGLQETGLLPHIKILQALTFQRAPRTVNRTNLVIVSQVNRVDT